MVVDYAFTVPTLKIDGNHGNLRMNLNLKLKLKRKNENVRETVLASSSLF